jgi:hypothetical protein
MTSANN